MPSVFISRNLKPNSPFHELGKEWQITAESLLDFTPVSIAEAPAADWYFFYSSKGVEFFLAQREPSPGVRLACLGKGAARVLRDHGYTPDFIGDGNPAITADQWLKEVVGKSEGGGRKSVVFMQARQSRASVQQLLGDEIEAHPLVVYDNQIRANFELPQTDYLIFTSPLNFEAYQEHMPLDAKQRIIGIGSTTAVTFSAAAVKEYRIATTPSEAGLVECLLDWEQTQPIEAVE